MKQVTVQISDNGFYTVIWTPAGGGPVVYQVEKDVMETMALVGKICGIQQEEKTVARVVSKFLKRRRA